MHTDTTPKEMPTGSANYPAGHTDSQMVPNPAGAGNDFAALAARLELASHTLSRSNVEDGASIFYPGRRSLSRSLPDLQPAANLLALIGGAHE